MPSRLFHDTRTTFAYILVVFAAISLAGFVLYTINLPFRRQVNKFYYSTYSHFVISPTMANLADKRSNVQYCGAADRLQSLDIYRPKRVAGTLPVVVYIHGGGWRSGSKASSFVSDYGAEIVKSGMTFISMNYRLAPKAIYPAQNNDVECALQYIKNNAGQLQIDHSRIGLFGESAGGELAAMAALTSPNKSLIKGVVTFYAPSDLWMQVKRKSRSDKDAIQYLGNSAEKAAYDDASPLFQPLKGAPPFLVAHGTNDKIVPYIQATQFVGALRRAGGDATLITASHANHDFNAASSPNRNTIEALTVAFFKSHL